MESKATEVCSGTSAKPQIFVTGPPRGKHRNGEVHLTSNTAVVSERLVNGIGSLNSIQWGALHLLFLVMLFFCYSLQMFTTNYCISLVSRLLSRWFYWDCIIFLEYFQNYFMFTGLFSGVFQLGNFCCFLDSFLDRLTSLVICFYHILQKSMTSWRLNTKLVFGRREFEN